MRDQVDTEFKIRWKVAGEHVHCTMYSRKIGQKTWVMSGQLILREDEWLAFKGAFKLHIIFEGAFV